MKQPEPVSSCWKLVEIVVSLIAFMTVWRLGNINTIEQSAIKAWGHSNDLTNLLKTVNQTEKGHVASFVPSRAALSQLISKSLPRWDSTTWHIVGAP